MFSSFNMFARLSPQVELRIWQKYRLQHCAMKCIEPAVNHPVFVIYHISWFHVWFSIIYWDEIQLASLCENSLLYFLNVDSFLRRPAPPCPIWESDTNMDGCEHGKTMVWALRMFQRFSACFSASAHISALYASTFSASSKQWIWLLIMKHNDMKGEKYKIGRL